MITKEEKLQKQNSPRRKGNGQFGATKYGGTIHIASVLIMSHQAVYKGDLKCTKLFIEQNRDLLTAKLSANEDTALHIAALAGHAEIEEDLNPESNNHQGAELLISCIIAQIYDIALDLVQQYPDLAIAVYKDSDESPNKVSTLITLATRHSAFPSGTWLNFWQDGIYSCMPIHSGRVTNFRRDIELPINRDNIIKQAAFTEPGGYNGSTGVPIYLHRDSFMVFIISDAFSLFSSATSVLMFLGILKSRYTEEEFLVSLPRKLIIGVFTLFVSITTMMLTFGTAIFISLHNRLSWISIPIVLLASVPVMIFVFPQVPLLYEILISTYGPSIFDRAKKCWH
ncbi:hypothetical protein F0562_005752 [Nyssa sinensis]|uniref:PGG domain-containing protein n=1 Tax=Nyssa sinensis TaxID=561372 RepID=A0A5J5AJ61_9ASTE|nr:hypothetical protein F0562_005752 [Nyssa sinensis]